MATLVGYSLDCHGFSAFSGSQGWSLEDSDGFARHWGVWQLSSNDLLGSGKLRVTFEVSSVNSAKPVVVELRAGNSTNAPCTGDATATPTLANGADTAAISVGGTYTVTDIGSIPHQLTGYFRLVARHSIFNNFFFSYAITKAEWIPDVGNTVTLWPDAVANLGLYTISSNASDLVSRFSGAGIPKLFQAGDSFYIYNLTNSSLLISQDGGGSFSNMIPSGASQIKAICQSSDTFAFSSANVPYFQLPPETASGWRQTTGNLPNSFATASAIGDETLRIPAIVGNSNSSITARARRTVGASPYTQWVISDSGLPTSVINDLEIGDA